MLARWQKLCRRRRSAVSLGGFTYVEAAVVADNDRRSYCSAAGFDGPSSRGTDVGRARHRKAKRARPPGLSISARARHKAGLNLGDCFALRAGKREDEPPLLFKGDDFRHTEYVERDPGRAVT